MAYSSDIGALKGLGQEVTLCRPEVPLFVHFVQRQPVWSSVVAVGAFFLTDAIPPSIAEASAGVSPVVAPS